MIQAIALRSLAAFAAILCVPALLGSGPISVASAADAAGTCASPRQMEGFKTCADVAKAEQEGALVLYSPDPEEGSAKLLAAFHAEFPKITTNFIRLQTGALYQKLMTERRANVFLVDALQLTDIGFVLDFQKRNGYLRYVSPEMSGYKADYKSQPEGYWTWASFIMAGIAYNPKLVPPDQVPKSWKDMLNPRWASTVSTKGSTSGLQHVAWYELKRLYGDEYWKTFTELKPRGFDSYVQQYDRLTSGQDAIAHTAQLSGYLLAKAKGAPIAFVFPEEGMVNTPGFMGAVAEAPHPNAAQLFMDWFLSKHGQKIYDDIMLLNSPRDDAEPPPGSKPVSEFKLLYPADWQAFLATHGQFVKEWDKITGVR